MDIQELAAEAGVDRGTLGRAEKGNASERTFKVVETWLDRAELDIRAEGRPAPSAESDMVELTVRIGALDWSATAKAPSHLADVIEHQLEDLMARAIREAREGREGRQKDDPV